MSKMTGCRWFKATALVLIMSFIAFDIAWAHPSHGLASQSNLGIPSVFQDAKGSSSFRVMSNLLAISLDIANYTFGDKERGIGPLPIRLIEQVLKDPKYSLSASRDGVDLSRVFLVDNNKKLLLKEAQNTKDGILLIPYTNRHNGRKFVIQIAEKGSSSSVRLVGHEWKDASDRFVVKVCPEDYRADPFAEKVEELVVSKGAPVPPLQTGMAATGRRVKDVEVYRVGDISSAMIYAIAKLENNIPKEERMPMNALIRFLDEKLYPDRILLVAKDAIGGEIIGYLFGFPREDAPEMPDGQRLDKALHEISWQVAPAYQGKGVGTALRREFRDAARQAGYAYVVNYQADNYNEADIGRELTQYGQRDELYSLARNLPSQSGKGKRQRVVLRLASIPIDGPYKPDVSSWELTVENIDAGRKKIRTLPLKDIVAVMDERSWLWARISGDPEARRKATDKIEAVRTKVAEVIKVARTAKAISAADLAISVYLLGSYPWVEQPNDIDILIVVAGERDFTLADVRKDSEKGGAVIKGLNISFEVVGIETLKKAIQGLSMPKAALMRRRAIAYTGAIPLAGRDIFSDAHVPEECYRTMHDDLLVNADLANWPTIKDAPVRIDNKRKWRSEEAAALDDWVKVKRSKGGKSGSVTSAVATNMLGVTGVIGAAASNFGTSLSTAELSLDDVWDSLPGKLSAARDFLAENVYAVVAGVVIVALGIAAAFVVRRLALYLMNPARYSMLKYDENPPEFDFVPRVYKLGVKSVPRLLDIVSDTDIGRSIKERAIHVLGTVDDDEARAALVKFLGYGGYYLSSAEAALTAQTAKAVPYLLAALDDPDCKAVEQVIKLLAKIKDKRCIWPLTRLLGRDGFKHKDTVLRALSSIKDPESIEMIMGLADDIGFSHRYDAIEALGNFGVPRTTGPIIRAFLSDPLEKHRQIAMRALVNIDGPEVEQLVEKLLSDDKQDPEIRRFAAIAIGDMKYEKGTDILVKVLSDKEETMRITALDALEKLGWTPRNFREGFCKAVALAGRQSKYSGAKTFNEFFCDNFSVINTSFKISNNAKIDMVRKALAHPSPAVRASAVLALGVLGDKEVVETLLEFLRDKDNGVVMSAIEVLGGIKDQRAVEPLIEMMSMENYEPIMNALLEITGEGRIAGMRKYLDEKHNDHAGANIPSVTNGQKDFIICALKRGYKVLCIFEPPEFRTEEAMEVAYEDAYTGWTKSVPVKREVMVSPAQLRFHVETGIESVILQIRLGIADDKTAFSAQELFELAVNAVPTNMRELHKALEEIGSFVDAGVSDAEMIQAIKEARIKYELFKGFVAEEDVLWLALFGQLEREYQLDHGAKKEIDVWGEPLHKDMKDAAQNPASPETLVAAGQQAQAVEKGRTPEQTPSDVPMQDAALESVRKKALQKIDQETDLTPQRMFRIVESSLLNDMEALKRAFGELEELAEPGVPAGTIEEKIAKLREKYQLPDEQVRLLRLALLGPGQGIGGAETLVVAAVKPESRQEAKELFEIVGRYVNNQRTKMVMNGKRLQVLTARHGILPLDGDKNFVNKGMTAVEIKRRLESLVDAVVKADPIALGKDAKKIQSLVERVSKNMTQFEADSIMASVIAKAIRIKRNNKGYDQHQKLYIGLAEDWIPEHDQPRSLEALAMHPIVEYIKNRLVRDLNSIGLDDVVEVVITKKSVDLPGELLKKTADTETDLSNVVALARLEVVSSDAFKALRSTPEKERAVLAGIDSRELEAYVKDHQGSSEDMVNIKIMEILSAVLEVASGKKPPELPGYRYDADLRTLVVVLPKMERIDYKSLRDRSIAEARALHSA